MFKLDQFCSNWITFRNGVWVRAEDCACGLSINTRSFFEAVAFVHVRFARVRFVLELFFVFETKFFPITPWEFDLIRRAHLLCILKRHHTYGVNTFVCSYSLNSNPSHSLVLSSLLDWQPYLLCGFPGFVTLLERRVRVPEPRDRSSTHRSTIAPSSLLKRNP